MRGNGSRVDPCHNPVGLSASSGNGRRTISPFQWGDERGVAPCIPCNKDRGAMSTSRTLRRAGLAVALLVAFLVQGTWVLAGTSRRPQRSSHRRNRSPCRGSRGQSRVRFADGYRYHRRWRPFFVPLACARHVHRFGQQARVHTSLQPGRGRFCRPSSKSRSAGAKGCPKNDRSRVVNRVRKPR